MNTWVANPPWQNFSSMFREAIVAQEARTGMEKAHHLTASLYFGIASLEAFLNQQMRAHMETESEEDIFNYLRKGEIIKKLKKWPIEILGRPLHISDETLELITLFNDIRGNLTHPKTHGHDIYATLEAVDPESVITSVAEYIVRFHETEGTIFPYWVFGWSYLNPRPDSYEIMLVNETQFCFSIKALGFRVSEAFEVDRWLNQCLRTFEGYEAVSQAINSVDRCEPKATPFPFKRTLCRRCGLLNINGLVGGVTDEMIGIRGLEIMKLWSVQFKTEPVTCKGKIFDDHEVIVDSDTDTQAVRIALDRFKSENPFANTPSVGSSQSI
jgi:hypothetical protein